MKSMYRIGGCLLAALALGACHRKGENVPLEVAEVFIKQPLVEQHVRISPPPPEVFPSEPVMVAGSRWRAGFTQYALPANALRPVATGAGTTFYALAWNSAPYDRLLVPVPGRAGVYREYLEIY